MENIDSLRKKYIHSNISVGSWETLSLQLPERKMLQRNALLKKSISLGLIIVFVLMFGVATATSHSTDPLYPVKVLSEQTGETVSEIFNSSIHLKPKLYQHPTSIPTHAPTVTPTASPVPSPTPTVKINVLKPSHGLEKITQEASQRENQNKPEVNNSSEKGKEVKGETVHKNENENRGNSQKDQEHENRGQQKKISQ